MANGPLHSVSIESLAVACNRRFPTSGKHLLHHGGLSDDLLVVGLEALSQTASCLDDQRGFSDSVLRCRSFSLPFSRDILDVSFTTASEYSL